MPKGLLEQLKEGIVIGDGGYVIALEKRGYVKAGSWTPEVVVEHPEAVRQLHREFLRAGSSVLQAFTFYTTEETLQLKKHMISSEVTCQSINEAACQIAQEVAKEGNGALVAGGVSGNKAYVQGKGKAVVQKDAKTQCDVFLKYKVDFIIVEYFKYVEEIEWVIEEAKKTGLPIMATMCISLEGDLNGVSLGECAVRMAKAGADVVGVNCNFDPFMTLDSMRGMKKALDKEGLKPFLATQPNGFYSTGTGRDGYFECPEYPFALEPRLVTRFDVHKYARQAYELGIRYIGGCCGFEAYHIRAIAEELSRENNGFLPPASDKHVPWGGGLASSLDGSQRVRATREYWENIVPQSGRPQTSA